MSEYLSKEEIKQWRSSLEKITLEDEINNIEIDPIEDLPDDVSDPGLIKEEPTTVATTN